MVNFLRLRKPNAEPVMKPKLNHLTLGLALLALTTLNPQLSTAHAQSTAITYQGQLNSGAGNANGSFDLRFAVYDANVAGNFIAGPITNSAVAVSNGLFTVALDFGAGVFTGTNYWVEMAVRTNGGGAFATLVPRQQLTPAPYALYAPQAGNAAALSAQAPQFNSLCPPGAVMAFAGLSAPAGWLLCDGSPKTTNQYPALFASIGYTYGGSSSSFSVPDLRGRTVAGKDNMGGTPVGRITSSGTGNPGIDGTVLGAFGGLDRMTLTADQSGMPNHTHPAGTLFAKWRANGSAQNVYSEVGVASWTANLAGSGGGRSVGSGSFTEGVAVGGSTGGYVTEPEGVSAAQAHSITQPTIILNYIIKY